ncbi:MAG TPA: DUF2288 family protein [Polyangiales bacterium]
MESDVRGKLRSEVMSSYWEDLAPHQARGALLLLAPNLDLLEVAEAMAADDSARVASWLKSGQLARVSAAEAEQLERTEDLRFQFVVVQPWVLAQRLG